MNARGVLQHHRDAPKYTWIYILNLHMYERKAVFDFQGVGIGRGFEIVYWFYTSRSSVIVKSEPENKLSS